MSGYWEPHIPIYSRGTYSSREFDQVVTSVMTHVLVLSAKVRRNDRLNSNFNLTNKITEEFAMLLISIFLHGKNLHHLILKI